MGEERSAIQDAVDNSWAFLNSYSTSLRKDESKKVFNRVNGL